MENLKKNNWAECCCVRASTHLLAGTRLDSSIYLLQSEAYRLSCIYESFRALWFSCKIMYYSSYTSINLCILKLEEYFNKSCFYLSSVCFSFESLGLIEQSSHAWGWHSIAPSQPIGRETTKSQLHSRNNQNCLKPSQYFSSGSS